MLRRDTVAFTTKTMASLSLLAVGSFRILQGRIKAPYLWLELKLNNNLVCLSLTGSLIMFQYPLSLVMLFPMFAIRFVECTVPMQSAYDFSWKKYATGLVKTILWLAFFTVTTVLLLFGTMLD